MADKSATFTENRLDNLVLSVLHSTCQMNAQRKDINIYRFSMVYIAATLLIYVCSGSDLVFAGKTLLLGNCALLITAAIMHHRKTKQLVGTEEQIMQTADELRKLGVNIASPDEFLNSLNTYGKESE